MKELTELCNKAKKDLDGVKAKLDEKAEEKKKQLREELMDDEEGD